MRSSIEPLSRKRTQIWADGLLEVRLSSSKERALTFDWERSRPRWERWGESGSQEDEEVHVSPGRARVYILLN